MVPGPAKEIIYLWKKTPIVTAAKLTRQVYATPCDYRGVWDRSFIE
jgi:hypothetical protein